MKLNSFISIIVGIIITNTWLLVQTFARWKAKICGTCVRTRLKWFKSYILAVLWPCVRVIIFAESCYDFLTKYCYCFNIILYIYIYICVDSFIIFHARRFKFVAIDFITIPILYYIRRFCRRLYLKLSRYLWMSE